MAKSVFELRKDNEQKHIKYVMIVVKMYIDEDLIDHMRNELYGLDEEFNCENLTFRQMVLVI